MGEEAPRAGSRAPPETATTMQPPSPSLLIALTAVRRDGRFLLIQEAASGLWYLPAGRVERGESFAQAAAREVREEAGVEVALDGLLRLEQSFRPGGELRLRAVFVGHPIDARPPKARADEHSLQARWVALAEIAELPLRGTEVPALLQAIERGAPIHPLGVLSAEDAPF